ncbi:hypothetical protein ACS0TY_033817 [Phlomoides rotata]
MSTLQEHLDSDVDLESNVVAGGGAGEVAAVGSGGGAEAKGAVENNGSKKDRDERRDSNFSVCSVDLELGVIENKLQFAASVKDCRICHLSMDSTNQDSGTPIELGCSCKDDLAAAHKQCAETWFKIKGNKTCEICGSIAQNVAGINEGELMEDWNDAAAMEMTHAPPNSQSRNFWHGHRLLNFLLACMVFAFVISWLFHFNVPS